MNEQTPLFALEPFTQLAARRSAVFGGTTFEPAFDADRLKGQYRRVWDVMIRGGWWTLAEIQAQIEHDTGFHDSQTGISARTRDFRKPVYGSHIVHSQRRGDAKRGVWEYQLQENGTL